AWGCATASTAWSAPGCTTSRNRRSPAGCTPTSCPRTRSSSSSSEARHPDGPTPDPDSDRRMLSYLVRRLAYMIPTLFLISVVAFAIIQLPPGDYLSTMVARLTAQGETVDPIQLQVLRERYGLDDPMVVQYGKWMLAILTRWDFGQSFEWRQPVADLLSSRMPLTIAVSVVTLLMTWIIAF